MMKAKSPLLQRAVVTIFLVMMGMHGQAQAADCYVPKPVIIDGKEKPNEPVCEVLARNLNRFCDSPPMVCGLEIHPDFQQELALPRWRQLAQQTDLKQVEEFIRAPWMSKESGARVWKRESVTIGSAYKMNRLKLAEAAVDIYNLEEKLPAYRLDLGGCERSNPQVKDPKTRGTWGQELNSNDIRIQHVPPVIRRLFKQYFPIGAGTISGDLFIFRGATYAYFMAGYEDNPLTGEIVNHLRVNRYGRVQVVPNETDLAMDNICLFEYRPYEEAAK